MCHTFKSSINAIKLETDKVKMMISIMYEMCVYVTFSLNWSHISQLKIIIM